MKLFVTIKQQNFDFKKDYAEQYNGGKESVGNYKTSWSRGVSVAQFVDKYNVVENSTFIFSGKLPNGEQFNYEIPNVTKVQCIVGDETFDVAVVSDKIVKKILAPHNKRYNTVRLYLYLKNTDEFACLSEGIFIALVDLPPALLKFVK